MTGSGVSPVAKADRRAVVAVLGPPRSGTSAITRALECLDVDLGKPEDHRTADPANPKGFWEDLAIIDLCARGLATYNLPWYGLQLLVREDWQTPRGRELLAEATDLVNRRVSGTTKGIWGCKNPQMGRMIWLWMEAFKQAHCRDCYVIALRNPLSVAASVISGSPHFGVGCSPTHLHLMWLVYQIGAMETVLAGKPAVVVDFDCMVANPGAGLERMAAGLGLPIPAGNQHAIDSYGEKFLDKNLRHTEFTLSDLAADPRVPGLVCRAYEALLDAAHDRQMLHSEEFRRRWGIIAQEAMDRNSIFRLIDQIDNRLTRSRYVARIIYRHSPRPVRRWLARLA
ncbi:MAG: hypothetical protein ACP5QA_07435 [Phycisphaerae bacterium]